MKSYGYQRYDQYRASGVPWLGQIPEHWDARKLKTFVRRVRRHGWADEQLLSVYRDHGVVPFGHIEGNFNRPSEDLSSYQLVEPGNLVLNKMKTWQGSLGVSSLRGIVSPAYIVCCVENRIHGRFLHYLLRSPSYISQFGALSYGVRVDQWDLRFEDFREIEALLPPYKEQEGISSFLDHETAKIDALIAKLEKLIERLEERRKALISRAVTRGLNPNVKMKDSGVESLERIPEHWQVVAMGFFSRIGNGSTPLRGRSDYWCEVGYPWLNSSVVNAPVVGEPSGFVTDLALSECHLPRVPAGSVLVALTGEGKTRGMATVLGYEATINQHLAFVTPRREVVDASYLRCALTAFYELLRFKSEGSGSTKGALTCTTLKRFKIALPPLAEQGLIVRWLEDRTLMMDRMVEQVGLLIECLREKRTALISDAVTGMILVREGA